MNAEEDGRAAAKAEDAVADAAELAAKEAIASETATAEATNQAAALPQRAEDSDADSVGSSGPAPRASLGEGTPLTRSKSSMTCG